MVQYVQQATRWYDKISNKKETKKKCEIMIMTFCRLDLMLFVVSFFLLFANIDTEVEYILAFVFMLHFWYFKTNELQSYAFQMLSILHTINKIPRKFV